MYNLKIAYSKTDVSHEQKTIFLNWITKITNIDLATLLMLSIYEKLE